MTVQDFTTQQLVALFVLGAVLGAAWMVGRYLDDDDNDPPGAAA